MPFELIAIGLTHRTSPVEVRERVALSDDEVRSLLGKLKGDIVREALILSTCNRTEIYALPADPEITGEHLIDFLLREKQLTDVELRGQFLKLTHCEAITHLFEVIAGIDSQILGDQQIHAQVKDAFRLSDESGTNGSLLTKVAHAAFRVAKRVKTETPLGIGAATISYAAVEFSRKVYADLRNRRALVIGAGETAELAAKHLIERNIGSLIVLNRTQENAKALLDRVRNGQLRANDGALSLDELETALAQSDLVISSTASDEVLVTKSMLGRALRHRESQAPMVLLDIAVPRDIDPECGTLPNVFLKDIDDLRSIVDQNLERRKEALPKVREIINEELTHFLALQSKLEVAPTIKELRDRFEAIRLEELSRNQHRFNPEDLAVVDLMTQRIMNRLLHTPTIMLKEPRASLDDVLSRVELLRALFALDQTDTKSE
jgi:glutamyl-tRNA reductase